MVYKDASGAMRNLLRCATPPFLGDSFGGAEKAGKRCVGRDSSHSCQILGCHRDGLGLCSGATLQPLARHAYKLWFHSPCLSPYLNLNSRELSQQTFFGVGEEGMARQVYPTLHVYLFTYQQTRAHHTVDHTCRTIMEPRAALLCYHPTTQAHSGGELTANTRWSRVVWAVIHVQSTSMIEPTRSLLTPNKRSEVRHATCALCVKVLCWLRSLEKLF